MNVDFLATTLATE